MTPKHESSEPATPSRSLKSTLERLASKGYLRHCGYEGTDEEVASVQAVLDSKDWFNPVLPPRKEATTK